MIIYNSLMEKEIKHFIDIKNPSTEHSQLVFVRCTKSFATHKIFQNEIRNISSSVYIFPKVTKYSNTGNNALDTFAYACSSNIQLIPHHLLIGGNIDNLFNKTNISSEHSQVALIIQRTLFSLSSLENFVDTTDSVKSGQNIGGASKDESFGTEKGVNLENENIKKKEIVTTQAGNLASDASDKDKSKEIMKQFEIHISKLPASTPIEKNIKIFKNKSADSLQDYLNNQKARLSLLEESLEYLNSLIKQLSLLQGPEAEKSKKYLEIKLKDLNKEKGDLNEQKEIITKELEEKQKIVEAANKNKANEILNQYEIKLSKFSSSIPIEKNINILKAKSENSLLDYLNNHMARLSWLDETIVYLNSLVEQISLVQGPDAEKTKKLIQHKVEELNNEKQDLNEQKVILNKELEGKQKASDAANKDKTNEIMKQYEDKISNLSSPIPIEKNINILKGKSEDSLRDYYNNQMARLATLDETLAYLNSLIEQISLVRGPDVEKAKNTLQLKVEELNKEKQQLNEQKETLNKELEAKHKASDAANKNKANEIMKLYEIKISKLPTFIPIDKNINILKSKSEDSLLEFLKNQMTRLTTLDETLAYLNSLIKDILLLQGPDAEKAKHTLQLKIAEINKEKQDLNEQKEIINKELEGKQKASEAANKNKADEIMKQYEIKISKLPPFKPIEKNINILKGKSEDSMLDYLNNQMARLATLDETLANLNTLIEQLSLVRGPDAEKAKKTLQLKVDELNKEKQELNEQNKILKKDLNEKQEISDATNKDKANEIKKKFDVKISNLPLFKPMEKNVKNLKGKSADSLLELLNNQMVRLSTIDETLEYLNSLMEELSLLKGPDAEKTRKTLELKADELNKEKQDLKENNETLNKELDHQQKATDAANKDKADLIMKKYEIQMSKLPASVPIEKNVNVLKGKSADSLHDYLNNQTARSSMLDENLAYLNALIDQLSLVQGADAEKTKADLQIKLEKLNQEKQELIENKEILNKELEEKQKANDTANKNKANEIMKQFEVHMSKLLASLPIEENVKLLKSKSAGSLQDFLNNQMARLSMLDEALAYLNSLIEQLSLVQGPDAEKARKALQLKVEELNKEKQGLNRQKDILKKEIQEEQKASDAANKDKALELTKQYEMKISKLPKCIPLEKNINKIKGKSSDSLISYLNNQMARLSSLDEILEYLNAQMKELSLMQGPEAEKAKKDLQLKVDEYEKEKQDLNNHVQIVENLIPEIPTTPSEYREDSSSQDRCNLVINLNSESIPVELNDQEWGPKSQNVNTCIKNLTQTLKEVQKKVPPKGAENNKQLTTEPNILVTEIKSALTKGNLSPQEKNKLSQLFLTLSSNGNTDLNKLLEKCKYGIPLSKEELELLNKYKTWIDSLKDLLSKFPELKIPSFHLKSIDDKINSLNHSNGNAMKNKDIAEKNKLENQKYMENLDKEMDNIAKDFEKLNDPNLSAKEYNDLLYKIKRAYNDLMNKLNSKKNSPDINPDLLNGINKAKISLQNINNKIKFHVNNKLNPELTEKEAKNISGLLTSIQNEIPQLNEEIKFTNFGDLKTKINSLESVDDNLSSFEILLNDSPDSQSLTKNLNSLKDGVKNFLSRANPFYTKWIALEKEIESTDKKINDLAKEIPDLDLNKDDAKVIKSKENNLATILKNLGDLELNSSPLIDSCTNLFTDNPDLLKPVKNLDLKIVDLKAKIEDVSNDISDVNKLNKDLESQWKILGKNYDDENKVRGEIKILLDKKRLSPEECKKLEKLYQDHLSQKIANEPLENCYLKFLNKMSAIRPNDQNIKKKMDALISMTNKNKNADLDLDNKYKKLQTSGSNGDLSEYLNTWLDDSSDFANKVVNHKPSDIDDALNNCKKIDVMLKILDLKKASLYDLPDSDLNLILKNKVSKVSIDLYKAKDNSRPMNSSLNEFKAKEKNLKDNLDELDKLLQEKISPDDALGLKKRKNLMLSIKDQLENLKPILENLKKIRKPDLSNLIGSLQNELVNNEKKSNELNNKLTDLENEKSKLKDMFKDLLSYFKTSDNIFLDFNDKIKSFETTEAKTPANLDMGIKAAGEAISLFKEEGKKIVDVFGKKTAETEKLMGHKLPKDFQDAINNASNYAKPLADAQKSVDKIKSLKDDWLKFNIDYNQLNDWLIQNNNYDLDNLDAKQLENIEKDIASKIPLASQLDAKKDLLMNTLPRSKQFSLKNKSVLKPEFETLKAKVNDRLNEYKNETVIDGKLKNLEDFMKNYEKDLPSYVGQISNDLDILNKNKNNLQNGFNKLLEKKPQLYELNNSQPLSDKVLDSRISKANDKWSELKDKTLNLKNQLLDSINRKSPFDARCSDWLKFLNEVQAILAAGDLPANKNELMNKLDKIEGILKQLPAQANVLCSIEEEAPSKVPSGPEAETLQLNLASLRQQWDFLVKDVADQFGLLKELRSLLEEFDGEKKIVDGLLKGCQTGVGELESGLRILEAGKEKIEGLNEELLKVDEGISHMQNIFKKFPKNTKSSNLKKMVQNLTQDCADRTNSSDSLKLKISNLTKNQLTADQSLNDISNLIEAINKDLDVGRKELLSKQPSLKLDDLKKEKSTDCDSALIPLRCVHG